MDTTTINRLMEKLPGDGRVNSAKKLAEHWGVSVSTARKYAKRLVEAGLLDDSFLASTYGYWSVWGRDRKPGYRYSKGWRRTGLKYCDRCGMEVAELIHVTDDGSDYHTCPNCHERTLARRRDQ